MEMRMQIDGLKIAGTRCDGRGFCLSANVYHRLFPVVMIEMALGYGQRELTASTNEGMTAHESCRFPMNTAATTRATLPVQDHVAQPSVKRTGTEAKKEEGAEGEIEQQSQQEGEIEQERLQRGRADTVALSASAAEPAPKRPCRKVIKIPTAKSQENECATQ